MKGNSRPFFPIAILFIALNTFFFFGTAILDRWNADRNVLLAGNTLLFAITLISFLIAKKGMNNPNPHAFVRSVYGSIMIKMFICMIVAFIYIASLRKELNKPALFICMGLYLLYTFIEVSILMKMLRTKNNG